MTLFQPQRLYKVEWGQETEL